MIFLWLLWIVGVGHQGSTLLLFYIAKSEVISDGFLKGEALPQ
jgi:hypothetical protein